MVQNPEIARGLLNIGGALMGDPVREAQTQAAISAARQRGAQAQLDEQTYDGRQKLTESLIAGDRKRGLAIGAGLGNDYTDNLTEVVGAMMGLPGSGVSEADLSQYLVGGGVQKAQDTFTGLERNNDASMARQRVASGVAVRAAQIRAGASERIAAANRAAAQQAIQDQLIEAVEDGVTKYVRQGDAKGMTAPSTVSEQQSNLLGQVAPMLMAGEQVNPQIVDIVGGSAPGRGGGPIGIEDLRLQIDTALKPYMQDADPALYAQAQAEIEGLIRQGQPPAAAILSVINRIAPSVDEGFLYDSEGPNVLADAMNPPPVTGNAAQNVTPGQDAQLQDARAAIAAGANPEAVAARLREMGIDPSLL